MKDYMVRFVLLQQIRSFIVTALNPQEAVSITRKTFKNPEVLVVAEVVGGWK